MYSRHVENGLVASENGLVASENGLVASEKGLHASENGLHASENGLHASENGLLASENGLPASESRLPASENRLPTSDNGALVSDNGDTSDLYTLTDILCPQGVYSSQPNGTFIQVFPDPDVKFSENAKYAVWAQGYITRLPWISDINNPDVNVIPHVSCPSLIRFFFLPIFTA
jgi:hypothetical protein